MSQAFTAEERHGDTADADSPRYAVRAVARRLGMPTATLRSWNQRYGIGPCQHNPGQHRLYSEADVAVVEIMRNLVGKGVSPGSAARAALESAIPKRADSAPLLSAAFDLDTASAGRLLDRHIRHFGVPDTWEYVVRPAFAAITARQGDGDLCIDVEHALSWTVSRSLQRIPSAPAGKESSAVILACTAGETHTLALEALRAGLDELGHGAVMLGADVPLPALVDAIERRPQDRVTVMLWSQHKPTADVAIAKAVVGAGAQLVVGGQGWVSAKLPRKAKRVANLRAALQHLTR